MSNSHNFKKKSQNLTTVIFWYDLQEVDREVIDSIRSVQREYIDKRGVEHNFTEVSSTKHFTTHPQVNFSSQFKYSIKGENDENIQN